MNVDKVIESVHAELIGLQLSNKFAFSSLLAVKKFPSVFLLIALTRSRSLLDLHSVDLCHLPLCDLSGMRTTQLNCFLNLKHLTHLGVIQCRNALDLGSAAKIARMTTLQSLCLSGSVNPYDLVTE